MAVDSAPRACSRCPAVAKGTKTEVAVRLQRAHTEFLGQGEGLLVVRCGGRDVRWFTVHGNLTEEPQCPCLPASPFAVAGVREGALGQPVGFLHASSTEIGLPTGEGTDERCRFPTNLPQHGEGVRHSSREGVGQREPRAGEAVIVWHVRVLTQGHRPFEQRDGRVQGALAHLDRPHTTINDETIGGTTVRLGGLERLGAIRHPVGKFPQLAEAPGHPETGMERERNHTARRLVARLPSDGRQDLLQVFHGLAVVAKIEETIPIVSLAHIWLSKSPRAIAIAWARWQ